MTKSIVLFINPCEKEMLGIAYSGIVTDSGNGSSHNNPGSAIIYPKAPEGPASYSCSE